MITQSTHLPLKQGEFKISYHRTNDGDCVSVAYGDVTQDAPIVRIHSSCLFSESFGGLICDCSDQLTSTLKLIKKSGSGVLVYRYDEGRGIGLEDKIRALELQRTQNVNTIEAFKQMGFMPDLRTYDVEIAALHDLQVSRTVRIASQNPRKIAALEGAGFELAEQIHPEITVTEHNISELTTKRELLGYAIPRELLLPLSHALVID